MKETEVVEPRGLWSAIRESLAGSHRDYTEGAIGRAILLLAMEHAGLHGAKLYPGSWSEWSSDPSRPKEKS